MNPLSQANLTKIVFGVVAVLATGWLFKYAADIPGIKQSREGYQGLL